MSVSETIKELYKKTNDSTVIKDYNITIDDAIYNNENIVFGSFSIDEKLCSSEQLTLGECNASMLKLTIVADVGDISKKSISVEQTINDNCIQIGVYNVDSCVLTANKRYREVVAYDNIYLFNVNVSDWYAALSFPTTQKEMLTSLCEYIGVTLKEVDLCNGDAIVEKTIDAEEVKGITVLKCIAELNGGFFRAAEDGEIEFVTLSMENIDETLEVKHYQTLKIEDFSTEKIDKLIIRTEENDIGASAGDGNNAYIIEGNFLVYGYGTDDLKTLAANVYEVVKNITYIPYTATQLGLPYIRCGNVVEYELTTGESFSGLILQRKLSGTQALKDSITTLGSQKTEETFGIEKELIKLKGKANVLKRSIEQTLSYIKNVEKGLYSEIKQTEDNISAMLKELGCLGNYGIDDFQVLFAIGEDEENEPEDSKYSVDFDWQNIGCEYLWIKSKTYYKNGTEITSEAICITNAIINNIQYCISKSKEQNTNEDEWSDVLDLLAWTKGKYIWYRILYQTEIGDTEIKISGYCDTSWETPIDLQALLELKLDKEKLISEINASADMIKLVSNRLIIQSDYFRLSEEGKVEAIAGKIGNWNIDEALYTSSEVFVNPEYEDALAIKNIVLVNTTPVTGETKKYDFSNDGNISILDALICRKLIEQDWDIDTVQEKYGYVPTLSNVYIKVDPNNPLKTIRIYAKAWDRDIDYYFGINGIRINRVEADAIKGAYVRTKSGVDLEELNNKIEYHIGDTVTLTNIYVPVIANATNEILGGTIYLDKPVSTDVTAITINTVSLGWIRGNGKNLSKASGDYGVTSIGKNLFNISIPCTSGTALNMYTAYLNSIKITFS